jgi:hypothetical protein
MITGKLLPPSSKSGHDKYVSQSSFIVRAPFAGHIDLSFFQEREANCGTLYKLYTPRLTKELWPSIMVYDNPDCLDHVDVRFNIYKYAENFLIGLPYYGSDAEGKKPCLIYDWKVDNFSKVAKGQHVCSILKNPFQHRKTYKIYSPASGIIAFGINGEKTEYHYQQEMCINDLFSVYKDRKTLLTMHYLSSEIINNDSFDGTISLTWDYVVGRKLPPNENSAFEENYTSYEMSSDSGKLLFISPLST